MMKRKNIIALAITLLAIQQPIMSAEKRKCKGIRQMRAVQPSQCAKDVGFQWPAQCCELRDYIRERTQDMTRAERRAFLKEQRKSDDSERVCCKVKHTLCSLTDDDDGSTLIPVTSLNAECVPNGSQCNLAHDLGSNDLCCSTIGGCDDNHHCCVEDIPPIAQVTLTPSQLTNVVCKEQCDSNNESPLQDSSDCFDSDTNLACEFTCCIPNSDLSSGSGSSDPCANAIDQIAVDGQCCFNIDSDIYPPFFCFSQ